MGSDTYVAFFDTKHHVLGYDCILDFKQARQEVAQVHSEVAGGHETKTSDADGRIRRKERRKKPKKARALLQYMELKYK